MAQEHAQALGLALAQALPARGCDALYGSSGGLPGAVRPRHQGGGAHAGGGRRPDHRLRASRVPALAAPQLRELFGVNGALLPQPRWLAGEGPRFGLEED